MARVLGVLAWATLFAGVVQLGIASLISFTGDRATAEYFAIRATAHFAACIAARMMERAQVDG